MATSTGHHAARFFGETSPKDLQELERSATRATLQQMAKAASYLQSAFGDQYYAWFGGWALKLRGSRRETKDLDLLVLADDVRQIRATLAPHGWAIMPFYEINGSTQERIFVDIGESGQVVAVDIVLSGELNTPLLGTEDSSEVIRPAFQTPQGSQVSVIALTWQVEGKLAAWISRRKRSDFRDLVFLCRTYGTIIQEWSEHLDLEHRGLFYDIFKASVSDEKRRREMKMVLSLSS